MANYSRLIAANLDLRPDYIDLIFTAAPMRDIGKIGIPDEILLKPGPLTPQEWKIMARHPLIDWDIPRDSESPLLQIGAELATSQKTAARYRGLSGTIGGTSLFDELQSRNVRRLPASQERGD